MVEKHQVLRCHIHLACSKHIFVIKDRNYRRKTDEWTRGGQCLYNLVCATEVGPFTTKGNQCESAEANSKDTAITVSDKSRYRVQDRKVEWSARE